MKIDKEISEDKELNEDREAIESVSSRLRMCVGKAEYAPCISRKRKRSIRPVRKILKQG